MAAYDEVHIRPSEITFFLSTDTSCSPEEVLLLSRSPKVLKYKVLCTARSKYSLSKCRGSLNPGESIRISIQLLSANCEASRKDFFKIQFFDFLDDSLRGERIISSVLCVDPAHMSFGAMGSGSCSSWPSRRVDSPISPGLRALSLTRNTHSLSSGQRTATTPSKSGLAAIDWTPQPKKLKATAVDRAPNVSPPGLKSYRSLSNFQSCSSCLRTLVCGMAFFLCLSGAFLPVFTDNLRSLLQHLFPNAFHSLLPTSAVVSSSTCDAPMDVTHSTSYLSQGFFAHKRAPPDEFTRQSKLALLSFKAAFRNLVGALSALDAIHLISNFSWFGLGLLVMYMLKHN